MTFARISLASVLAGGAILAPVNGQAKPRPSIHREAAAAVKQCQPYAEEIKKAERVKKLARHTLTAELYKESRCNPRAHNKKADARGLGQQTASGSAAVRRILKARGEAPWFKHADAFDPIKSIRAAAIFLAYGLEKCGSLVEAIGAYNSGRCRQSSFARAVLRLADAIRAVAGEEPRT